MAWLGAGRSSERSQASLPAAPLGGSTVAARNNAKQSKNPSRNHRFMRSVVTATRFLIPPPTSRFWILWFFLDFFFFYLRSNKKQLNASSREAMLGRRFLVLSVSVATGNYNAPFEPTPHRRPKFRF